MIDGIPNRPLYFYQKDIIGARRIFCFRVVPNVTADHWGGQTHRDEPPFRMGIQKGAEVLHSHETIEWLGILATDFLGIRTVRTSTLRSFSTSSHFEYITRLRYPFSKRHSHII